MMIPPVQEKDRDKKEKEKDAKEKDKKSVNGNIFTPISSGQGAQCSQCNKAFNSKEAYQVIVGFCCKKKKKTSVTRIGCHEDTQT